MNKFLCLNTKQRGTFKRVMCEMCSYISRCVDFQEYKHGHSDELREGIHSSDDVTRDHIGKI